MDPILAEVYSTVAPSLPFVLGAYLAIWIIMLVFLIVNIVRSRKTQKDIDALSEAVERLESKLETEESAGDAR